MRQNCYRAPTDLIRNLLHLLQRSACPGCPRQGLPMGHWWHCGADRERGKSESL